MAPLLRSLRAEPLELALERRRLLRTIEDAMASAKLGIDAALTNAPDGEWVDVDTVCKGLIPEAVAIVVEQLAGQRRVDVEQGRVRRGPRWKTPDIKRKNERTV
jgi:hypothetical protein